LIRRRLFPLTLLALALSLVVSACGSSSAASVPTPTTTPSAPTATSAPNTSIGAGDVQLAQFAQGLQSAVYLAAAPGQTDRLYVVRQTGLIMVVNMDGSVRSQPFLDIRQIVDTSGSERGLLSMVFHPDFAQNGYFYVNYTGAGGAVTVARYHVTPTNSYTVDPSSAHVILTMSHPVANHNGGVLQFGRDGYLYISIGDGGNGNSSNGQRKNLTLGKILRIDVNHTSGSQQYAIPADNPFVNQSGVRPEIWAYGLRNPWRYSFDRATGDLYIGDVGQNIWEELNYQPAASKGGQNYGWAIFEGDSCYASSSACSSASGLTKPIYVYKHQNGNCVITGGYVYRGKQYPSLIGTYFFADYCSGRVWAFPAKQAQTGKVTPTQVLDTKTPISSFGEDNSGELYVVSLSGTIYRLTA
jgi:glucose/arabinose dehydrogenase